MKPVCLWAVPILAALVGCTLTRTDLRQGADRLWLGLGKNEGGRLFLPKFCSLQIAIAARPTIDEALHQVLWRSADLQVIGDETRKALETNGIRIGVVTGDLPPEVRAILEAPPPHKIDPVTLMLPDGESQVVDLAVSRAELDLLMSHPGGSVGGKRYQDAKGELRISATRGGESGVALRISPEIQHGPVRQGWSTAAASGVGPLTSQQFVMNQGQKQETFRDLTANITLSPGQVLIIGGVPDKRGTLGHFLFTTVEPNSDRELGKVVFIRAKRSEDGTPDLPTPALMPADPPESPDTEHPQASQGEAPKKTTPVKPKTD